MTIYGEADDRFRPSPSRAAFVIASAASLAFAVPLVTLLIAMAESAIVRAAGWRQFWIVEPLITRRGAAEIFHDSILVSSWVGSSERIIAVFSIVAALALIGYYPISNRFGSRIALHAIAQAFAAIGAVAPAVVKLSRYRVSELSDLVVAGLILLGGAAVIALSELRFFDDLAHFKKLEHAGRRFIWWSLHVPAGAAIVAFAAMFAIADQVVIAMISLAVITLIAAIARSPRGNPEKLEHRMRVAPVLATLLAVAALGGTVAVAGRIPPLVIADGNGYRLVERSYVEEFLQAELERKTEAEKPEEKIMIRWSRERK